MSQKKLNLKVLIYTIYLYFQLFIAIKKMLKHHLNLNVNP